MTRYRVKNRIQPGDGDLRHGTQTGYGNHMCRCPHCCAAGHEYERTRLRRNGRKPRWHKDHLHPSLRCYLHHGCRCPGCETQHEIHLEREREKVTAKEVSLAERQSAKKIAGEPLVRIGRVQGKPLSDAELLRLRVQVGLVSREDAVTCAVAHGVIGWDWSGGCPATPTQEVA